MRLTLLLIALFGSYYSISQESDSTLAASIYQQAETHYSKREYDSAIADYTSALRIFRASEAWEAYTRCLFDVGYVHYRKRNYAKSDSLFAKGLREAEVYALNGSLSWTKNYYGRILIKDRYNEFDSVLNLVSYVLANMKPLSENREMELKLLDTKASAYSRLGIYDRAIDAWKEHLDVVNTYFEGEEEQLIEAYEQLGYNYALNRNYIQADGYLNRALEYRKANADTKSGRIQLAQLYNSIGGSYLRSKRLEASRDAYRKANKIAVEELGENSRGAIFTLANVGITYIENRDDSAKWYLEKALNKELEHLPGESFVIGNSYLNLGMAQLNLREYKNALDSYKNSIAFIRKTTSGYHSYFSKSYNQLGFIFKHQGLYDSAAHYFNKAMEANILNERVSPTDLSANVSDYLDLHNLISSIRGKAILLVEHQYQDTNANKLATIKDIDIAISLIEKSLRNLSRQESIEDSMNGLLHDLTIFGGNLAMLLYEDSNDRSYLEQVLGYAEMDRASVLRSLISKNNAIELAGIPDSIIGKIHSLDQKVAVAKSDIIRQSSDNPDGWKHLQELTERREVYYENIENRYPLFENLRRQSKTVAFQDIQNVLGNDQALVEYFIGLDSTYAMVFTKDAFQLFSVAENEQLTALIERQRDNAYTQNFPAFSQGCFRLYQQLFAQIDQFLSKEFETSPQVIIVPDESIGYVSFSILSPDSLSTNFLVDKYSFSYEPSALVALNRKSTDYQGMSLLGMAPDFSSPQYPLSDGTRELVRDSLRPLPGVTKELEFITEVISGDVLLGQAASEKHFKVSASKYNVIHLATHAIVDDEMPGNSRLFFETGGDETEDGALHAYEIYNLQLNAQLVTLSACNTGIGKIKIGEGVMSLSRAFSHAGVPATVVSLWPASDQSTPELMKYFYQNLKEGQRKDVALNNARKSYLANASGKARHPFYWGGFVLIGDNSPIENERNLLVWVIPITLILVLIITVYRRRN